MLIRLKELNIIWFVGVNLWMVLLVSIIILLLFSGCKRIVCKYKF